MGDYLVYLNTETGLLTVDWSNSYHYYIEQYNVAVESNGKVIFATNVSYDVEKIENIAVDPAASEITVSLSFTSYGSYSDIHKVTVHPSQMGMTILTDKLTNSSQAEISYSVNEQCDAYVTLGDSVNEKILLDGSGSFSIPLNDGYNNLKVMQVYSENVIFLAEKRILVDKVAPTMEFFENLSNVITEETSFVVVGKVESGSSFTMNGEAQTIGSDGSFSLTLNLVQGTNSFEFIAKDAAGNSTVRTVSITCTAQGAGGAIGALPTEVLVIIIVAAVLLALAIATIVLLGVKKKLNKKSAISVVSVLFILITVTLVIVTCIKIGEKDKLGEIVNGEKFFEIAKESIDKANDYLVAYDNAKAECEEYVKYMIIAIVVTVLTCGANAAVWILSARSGKSGGTDNPGSNDKPKIKFSLPKFLKKADSSDGDEVKEYGVFRQKDTAHSDIDDESEPDYDNDEAID